MTDNSKYFSYLKYIKTNPNFKLKRDYGSNVFCKVIFPENIKFHCELGNDCKIYFYKKINEHDVLKGNIDENYNLTLLDYNDENTIENFVEYLKINKIYFN